MDIIDINEIQNKLTAGIIGKKLILLKTVRFHKYLRLKHN